jgi:hypothetical protein
MSWSASFDVVNNDVVEGSGSESNVEVDYHSDQYTQAIVAAFDLINSGVFGDPDNNSFRVTFSGHGNPGHVPLAGWSNDSISISIYQLNKV